MPDLADQQLLPIANTVEVINGNNFNDIALYPRIKPLLNAHTVGDLTKSVNSVKQSLEFLGTKPEIKLCANEPEIQDVSTDENKSSALPVRTVVDLSKVASNSWNIDTIANLDYALIQGRYSYFNALKIGDVFDLRTDIGIGNSQLSSGLATWSVPTINPVRIVFSGFYGTIGLPILDCAIAEHNVSAVLMSTLPFNVSAKFGLLAANRHICFVHDSASDIVRAKIGLNSLKTALFANFEHRTPVSVAKASFELSGQPGDASHLKSLFSFRTWFKFLSSDASDSLNSKLRLNFNGCLGVLQSLKPVGERLSLCDSLQLEDTSLLRFKKSSLDSAQNFIYNAQASLLTKLPGKPIDLMSTKFVVEVGQVGQLSQLGEIQSMPLATVAAGLTYSTKSAKFDLLYAVPLTGDQPRLSTGIEVQLG